MSGLVQVDTVVHRQSSVDELDPATRAPLNEDRIVLRRGRLALDATRGYVGARLELDMNTVRGLSVRPFEGYVFARYPNDAPALAFSAAETASSTTVSEPELAARASAGLMRIPFGFDAVEPDAARPLLERGLATRAFFGQARDLGIGVDARYRFARLSLAAMNGEPLADDRYAGLDLTRSKDVVGRAGVSTPLSEWLWVQGGVSWLFGHGLHLGTAATKGTLQWVDGNEDGQVDATELVPIAGSPGSPSRDFERSAIGADLRVGVRVPWLGLCVLRAELTRALNLDRSVQPADPIASGRNLRELGAQVGLSQELTSHAELALRYDLYRPDADATRSVAATVVPRDTTYRTWSLALAGKLAPGRLIAQYDQQRNALGRSASGAPTTLKDDAFTLRAEVRLP